MFTYWLQPGAVLYAARLPAGTLMARLEWPPIKFPSVGGDTALQVTRSRELQLKNALPPIEVREAGKVTEVRLIQLKNALPPIEVREAGKVTEVRLLQPENA